MASDELLREAWSKWPDRFSRRDACSANPESFREIGVDGCGNLIEVGEAVLGEDGLLFFEVELVEGRSLPLEREASPLEHKKVL